VLRDNVREERISNYGHRSKVEVSIEVEVEVVFSVNLEVNVRQATRASQEGEQA
jgi:hypothetical protein